MKATGLVLLVSLLLVPHSDADEAALRVVIGKGLGYIAAEGERWMEEKSCNGCHHMPELLWSHREAKRRGFEVNQTKFDEWLSWSVERAADKKPGLEEAALMILAMPERPAPELIKLISAEQGADGAWKPAGQFATMQKRGAQDATANAVRLHLIALASARPAAAEAEAARGKAGAVLQKATSPAAMESLVFRSLYARQFGKPEEVEVLMKEMVKQQRGDGGWSSFIGENMSDSLATGQVLYALGQSPKVHADAITRAQAWLIKTQRADGSWPIDITHISKVDRSAQGKAKSFKEATEIYTYWGSAWAVIGLLLGVPIVEVK